MGDALYDPNRSSKLGSTIVAAPDLDLDVVVQRIIAEEFTRFGYQVSIYMSKTDVALGLSMRLLDSRKRIGRVGADDLPRNCDRGGSSSRTST